MRKITAAVLMGLLLTFGVAACGDDDEDTTTGAEATSTEATAESAEEVTVTTGDTADGFSWEVSPTPTAETTSITYVNESEQDHALVFAQVSEGYTFEEAYELEGKKGSATDIADGGAKAGDTSTVEVKGEIEPGNYVLFCPIPGHYEQGQLSEFTIE